MGFGVWGLGFGVWGLGFGVWGLGFRDAERGVSEIREYLIGVLIIRGTLYPIFANSHTELGTLASNFFNFG